jgi:hypothetical protein
MIIAPVTEFFPTSRQGGLHHLRQLDIEAVLGFSPTVEAYDKVEAEWNFIVDGIRCAIWDYKGSAELGFWSFFGPRQIFVHLFGAEHVS